MSLQAAVRPPWNSTALVGPTWGNWVGPSRAWQESMRVASAYATLEIVAALLAQLQQLHNDLTALIKNDPEQEVTGAAFPLLDAVLSEARDALPSISTLRSQVADLLFEAITTGEHVRAADALVLVGQLLAALQHYATEPPEEVPASVVTAPDRSVFDHLSPIHRSSRVEGVQSLYTAIGLASPLNQGVRSSVLLGKEFRELLQSLLRESKLTKNVRLQARSQQQDGFGGWELASPTNTSMVTLELGGNPYETSFGAAAQATFSRYSQFAPNLATLVIHIGVASSAEAGTLLSLNDLFWQLGSLLETAVMTEVPALFERGGAEGPVFGPALFVGDGRQDIAQIADCSELSRLPEPPHFSVGASYAGTPSDVRDNEARRAFIIETITGLLIDAGFSDAEDRVQRLPD